jgi:uncharacterized protein (TIGR03435 family)
VKTAEVAIRATILDLVILAIPTVGIAQSNAPLASGQSSANQALPLMPSDAKPAFDVATIKPSDTSAPHGRFFRLNGRHVIAYNMSVGDLVTYAYGIQASQIANGPPSLLAKHFDIDGLPDIVGRPNRSQSRQMFQQLLVSRFRLAFHYESRELPVYAIQIAKGGPKLAQTTRKPDDGTNFSYTCPPVLAYRNYSISEFAKVMQEAFLDRPVVDQTGLTNRYDFDLKWTSNDAQTYCPAEPGGSHDDPNAPPSIYTAIQEQLGLKIVAMKAPAQVMVIDHIETPSEN